MALTAAATLSAVPLTNTLLWSCGSTADHKFSSSTETLQRAYRNPLTEDYQAKGKGGAAQRTFTTRILAPDEMRSCLMVFPSFPITMPILQCVL